METPYKAERIPHEHGDTLAICGKRGLPSLLPRKDMAA